MTAPTKRRPTHREDTLQRAVLAWLRAELPALARHTFHVPNGGKRGAIEAARFKSLGVKAGVPDLITLAPRHGYHGAVLELKAKGKKPTPSQRDWLQALAAQGFAAGWADSIEAARSFYRRYESGTLGGAAAQG